MNRNCRILPIVASLFLLTCIFAGCTERTKNPTDMKEADRDDAVLVAITRDGKFYLGQDQATDKLSLPDSGTEIRVRNASKVDLTSVVIDGKKFGDIKHETTTEYRKSESAHRYPSASLSANSKPLETPPMYGVDTELGAGRFTYVLTVQYGRLSVHTERDKD